MPIYEYVCTDCAHEFEALQKMADDPLKFCPECGDETLKKKISASAFVLKGTGWYETDFKNNGKKGKDSSSESSGSSSESKSDSKKSSDSSGESSKSSGSSKPDSSSTKST
ncbi:MAG: putative FmdB family regulatory protein [Parasphingorhabdus sp.]|jgi:putative FmdB family regulatory protein